MTSPDDDGGRQLVGRRWRRMRAFLLLFLVALAALFAWFGVPWWGIVLWLVLGGGAAVVAQRQMSALLASDVWTEPDDTPSPLATRTGWRLRTEEFVVTSRLSTARATAVLEQLSWWRGRLGASGRFRDGRLRLMVADGTRSVLLPVLVGTVEERHGHLVVRGFVRPVRGLAVLSLAPLVLWVDVVLAPNWPVFLVSLFVTLVLGWVWSDDRREFPARAAELQRALTYLLDGKPLRDAK
jgi:hypothetical protein